MRVMFASILSLVLPIAAFAAGSGNTSPPKPVVKMGRCMKRNPKRASMQKTVA